MHVKSNKTPSRKLEKNLQTKEELCMSVKVLIKKKRWPVAKNILKLILKLKTKKQTQFCKIIVESFQLKCKKLY